MPTSPELPLVSVIIPTYNRPDYLRAAIASACQQTYPNLEIIVSDDCSQINPQTIVDSFGDPRLRLRRNPTNLGVGLNTTHAATEATGTYVAFLNDDDLWEETFLETLVAPLEADPSLVLAFCDHYIIDAAGQLDRPATEAATRLWQRDRLAPGRHQPFSKMGLVDQSVYAASAAVIRHKAIAWERLHEAGVFWDYFLVYLACRGQGGAFYVRDRLVHYRVHDQSETTLSGSRSAAAKIRKGKAAIACHDTYRRDPALADLRPIFQRRWAEANATLGIGLLRDGNVSAARPYLFKAIQGTPLNPRPLAALLISLLPQPLAQPLLYPKSL